MTIAEQESSEVDESVGTADRVSGRENAVLRLSETEAASLSLDPTDDIGDTKMIINMGPSHPSTGATDPC